MEAFPRLCRGALRSMPLAAANQRCVAMLYLVRMLAGAVKVQGFRLRPQRLFSGAYDKKMSACNPPKTGQPATRVAQ